MTTWSIDAGIGGSAVGLPFPIAEIAPDGRVLAANAAWTDMASPAPDLVAALGLEGNDAERVEATLAAHRRSGTTDSIELDVPPLGLLRWCRLYVAPGRDPGSATVAIVPLRRLAEAGGPEHEEFLTTYEYLSEGVLVLDPDMRIRIATGFATNFMGVPGSEYEGRAALHEIHPHDQAMAIEVFGDILQRPGEQLVRDLRIADTDGGFRWVEVVATNLLDHPRVGGVLVMLRDIAARKAAEQLVGQLVHVLDVSPDLFVLFDRDGTPLYSNRAAAAVAGARGPDDERGVAIDAMTRRLHRQLPISIGTGTTAPWQGEVTLTDDHGVARTYSVVAVAGAPGHELDVLACIGRDITDRKRLEAELAHRALHDPLTGLPNRAALLDRLGRSLREQPFSDRFMCVMFLDLDNLKDINDSVGHEAGDEVLVDVARRLRVATRPGDVVSRLGGDEFVVLCPAVPSVDVALEIAERVRQAVTGRTVVNRTDVFLSASVGVTIVPPHRELEGSPAEAALHLLRDADTAMYDAKLRGRARVALFTTEMHERANARMSLTAGLDRALADGQLTLVYQPILDIGTHRLTGFEALLRWHHPVLGLLTPARFVELAEETGLIIPIGTWVLDRALTDIASWRRTVAEAADLSVSVNISARQLHEPGIVELVGASLLTHRLNGDALVLEVTESALIDDATGGIGTIDRLRQLGLNVAIDDFGTGYSSLSYLRRFRADQLKLDGSFVEEIDHEPVSAAIVRSVVELAHAIGMTVVAESVTSSTQLELLAALGCDRAQGYFVGRPGPASEVPDLIERFGVVRR